MSAYSHVPTSVVAFVTTIHLAFVVLRAHRRPAHGPAAFVIGVSLLLSASPWLMPTPPGLAAGAIAHALWFLMCERWLPTATPAIATAVRSAPAPPVSARIVAPALAPIATAASTAPKADRTRARRDFVPVAVLAVHEETPDIRTFRLRRPEDFEFRPGQFVPVRVRADGKEYVRCYSITSSPACTGYIEITVKRIGLVSGTLHASLRPGSTVAVKSPAGAFVYPHGEDRPLVFLAGGVGITPLMCMLRHAVGCEPTRPVTLFYSVRTEDDIAFRDELWMLARRHPQFRLFVAITDGPAGSNFYPGRINEALLETMAPDIALSSCFICGPRSMLATITEMLQAVGVPKPQIHHEVFEMAIAAAAGLEPAAPPTPTPTAASPSTQRFEARFAKCGRTAQVKAGATLLETAEACGAPIPSLCRAGICGTCRTKVLAGDLHCASATLDERDRQDGYVLACVTKINSSCTIDA